MQRQRSVGFAVKALANQIKRVMDNSSLHQHSGMMTGMQFGIIAYVLRNSDGEGVFQRDLEAAFNIRRSTVCEILKTMERNDLIRREPVEYDARLKRLVLTDRAIELQQMCQQDMAQLESTLTQGLSEEELESFYSTLQKMIHNLEALESVD